MTSPSAADWVLQKQADALQEHEKRIANHTAIQSWTAIISLAMSVITTIALIFIAYSQYRVSERQVALEYAKSAPQFYAQVEQEWIREESGAMTGLELPTSVSLRLVHGDITVKSISVIQEMNIRRDNHVQTPRTTIECILTFEHWFDLAPDQLEAQADARVSQMLPHLSFVAKDGQPAYLDRGATRIYVRYDDIFGNEHTDVITVPDAGPITVVKDADFAVAHEMGNAYMTGEDKRQPFNLFQIPRGCQDVLTKDY